MEFLVRILETYRFVAVKGDKPLTNVPKCVEILDSQLARGINQTFEGGFLSFFIYIIPPTPDLFTLPYFVRDKIVKCFWT